jgi:hypothetical protein
MTTEPRAALDRLIAALEAHLHAASNRQGEADPSVVAAYQTLADAFESYDEALYDTFDEVTPFVLYDDAEDARDDEDLDEDDEEDEDDEDLDEDDLDVNADLDDELELEEDDDVDEDEDVNANLDDDVELEEDEDVDDDENLDQDEIAPSRTPS